MAKVTTGGSFTEYSITGTTGTPAPQGIASGPDGNLWITEDGSGFTNPDYIGKVTTSGSFTQYSLGAGPSALQPSGITAGPDGNLWFVESGASGTIVRITTSGTITQFTSSAAGSQGIALGPDGDVWVAEATVNKLAKVNPGTGTLTEYSVVTSTANVWGMTSGPNNAIWFTERSTNKIAEFLWTYGGAAPGFDPGQSAPQAFGPFTVAAADGDVQLQYPLLLTQSTPGPNDPPLPSGLVYNSNTTNYSPIIQVTYQSDPNGSVPSPISATLTWNNGSPQSAVSFSTTGHSAGDFYLLNTQVSSAVSSTGLYPWSVSIQATFGSDTLTRTSADSTPVVVNGDTPFGKGWSIAGLDKLVSVTGGELWVYGAGGAQFFSVSLPIIPVSLIP